MDSLKSRILEVESKQCTKLVLDIILKMLAFTEITASIIKSSHRLGSPRNVRRRPLFVKCRDLKTKGALWTANIKLRGSSIKVKQFLTKGWQLPFIKARTHFGFRACWTQDRHKITSMEELNTLMKKCLKVSGHLPTADRIVERVTVVSASTKSSIWR